MFLQKGRCYNEDFEGFDVAFGCFTQYCKCDFAHLF